MVWPGLDAQETSKTDTAVWALQTGDGRRYARVNTAVGELDTVRTVANPSQVVQTAQGAYLFSDDFTTLTEIDPALPADLDEDTLRTSPATPAGTVEVATAGDFVAYRTDAGTIFAGRLGSGGPAQIEPTDSGQERRYSADAVTVDARGMLFSYSAADAAVLTCDLRSGRVRPLRSPRGGGADHAGHHRRRRHVGGRRRGGRRGVAAPGPTIPTVTPTTGAVIVGEPDPAGGSVYLADETALVQVPVDGSPVTTVVGTGTAVLGAPARPRVHDGEVYAAWLPEGEQGGVPVELPHRAVGAGVRRRDARRAAPPRVRGRRRRDHPQRDPVRLGVDDSRRCAGALQSRTGRSTSAPTRMPPPARSS